MLGRVHLCTSGIFDFRTTCNLQVVKLCGLKLRVSTFRRNIPSPSSGLK
ncbi:hypothetical protein L798_14272 [Zootermopsis nevadensis]|uniref:Uncharacterized protein n=1 Tax=Zootermopsis nevadensis TaxID=136037 RepID=A0A067R218_ZOONE|nr:hypothetical protein L798_14272 [Zootermopsis nevadensis]